MEEDGGGKIVVDAKLKISFPPQLLSPDQCIDSSTSIGDWEFTAQSLPRNCFQLKISMQ